MPEVSVILPNYNHARFLKQRIESILNQTFSDFELIILDDFSSDNSRSRLESCQFNEKVSHYIVNDKNSGSPFLQWSKGISLAKGKYIWIAESDDYIDTTFLELGVRSLSESDSDFFYCKSVQVDSDGNYLRGLDWWLADLRMQNWKENYSSKAEVELNKFLIRKNHICNASSVLFRNRPELTEYLKAIVHFRFCGDWLFWLQYLKDSNRVVFNKDCINYWRDHASTTRSYIDFDRNIEMLKIYHWIAENVLKSESFLLFNYYYKHHIFKKSRKHLGSHLKFIWSGFKYSRYGILTTIAFYLNPKRYLP